MLGLIAALLIAAVAAGCGSGSSSSSESSSATDSTTAANQRKGSTQFLKPGVENKIATFGREASAAEREEASKVLEENLQARASGDWEGQCASLVAATVKQVEGEATTFGAEGASCAKALEAQAKPLAKTKVVRVNNLSGSIAALRVEGDKAYALFHGTDGADYAMPMNKEGDEWKVASLLAQELP